MAQILIQMTRDAERTRKAQLRQHVADSRAQKRLHAQYQADRTVQVVEMNAQLKSEVVGLDTILADALATDNYLDLESFKVQPKILPFDPGQLAVVDAPPTVSEFRPELPGFFQRLLPGANARHKRALAIARREYEAAVQAYKQSKAEKRKQLIEARAAYSFKVASIKTTAAEQHRQVDRIKTDAACGRPQANLYRSGLPGRDPNSARDF